jgi:hypothetical protein
MGGATAEENVCACLRIWRKSVDLSAIFDFYLSLIEH